MVFRDDEVIFTSSSRGVAPLLEVVDAIGLEELRGVVTVDRVVGKAAALLNLYIWASEVHAMVISVGAERVLQEYGVECVYWVKADAIKEKDGVIVCPFERLVQDISDPAEAYVKIVEKLAQLSG
jgi:hypothetical protein